MSTTRETMTLAVEIAEQLLKNGSEIYRVADTVSYILKGNGIVDFDVYAISNGIFASANEGKEDSCSIIRRVPLDEINLEKVSALNQLAREVAIGECGIDEAWDRLDEINKIRKPRRLIRTLSYGVGSGGFAYLFGGGIAECIIALVIGSALGVFIMQTEKYAFSRYTQVLFNSVFVAALSLIPIIFGFGVSYNYVVAGSIMPLVPGIMITTSIRDFFNGDHVSGTIHIIDAIMTSFCIAAGVGAVIYLYRIMGGAGL